MRSTRPPACCTTCGSASEALRCAANGPHSAPAAKCSPIAAPCRPRARWTPRRSNAGWNRAGSPRSAARNSSPGFACADDDAHALSSEHEVVDADESCAGVPGEAAGVGVELRANRQRPLAGGRDRVGGGAGAQPQLDPSELRDADRDPPVLGEERLVTAVGIEPEAPGD